MSKSDALRQPTSANRKDCQSVDNRAIVFVNNMTHVLQFWSWKRLEEACVALIRVILLWGWSGASLTADFCGGSHGLERARDYLRGARAIQGVGGFRLEQLRVGENDSELVVQTMKQESQFG